MATGNPHMQLTFRSDIWRAYLARKEFVQLLLNKHVISNQLDGPVRFS